MTKERIQEQKEFLETICITGKDLATVLGVSNTQFQKYKGNGVRADVLSNEKIELIRQKLFDLVKLCSNLKSKE